MNASRTVVSLKGMVDRTIASRPQMIFSPYINNEWNPYFHTIIILIGVSAIACIARVVKETHRGRITQRLNEKKSDHRIEQSPRRHESRLDEKQPLSLSVDRNPQSDKQSYISCFPDITRAAVEASEKDRSRMVKDKELYWKLQNLEDHRDAVHEARIRLIELFDQTLSESLANPTNTILSLPSYESSSLRKFLQTSHRSAASRYEAYLDRRKAGGPREMYPTREFALEWVRLAGVVKYVDGGWLGSILGIGNGKTASLAKEESKGSDNSGQLERLVSKMAWQVISEEFGDGDLQKNHIYLYEKLMNDIKAGALQSDGATCPGNIRGFDGLLEDQGVPRCWEAAIAQQCIGLLASSREFFPEALGFNMAYESLPYHLLVSARELKELNIDNYYFAIHVTIDNADSGHSAMARMAVERYLEGIKERDGELAMRNIWKRIQTGYILAEGLPTTPSGPVEFEKITNIQGQSSWQPRKSPSSSPTPSEAKLADVIVRKAGAAEKMHCTSRMRIGNLTVEEWLDPDTITNEKALSFIRALATKRPFVVPGEPVKSRFVRDIEWGGKMFGAFTGMESDVVREWIKSLEPKIMSKGSYTRFVGASRTLTNGQSELDQNISPFEKRVNDMWTIHDTSPVPSTITYENLTPKDLLSQPIFNNQSTSIDFSQVRSIWYTATSLFECFPLQPSRYATPLGMFSLRLIRSQLGFGALHRPEDICAGTDDLTLERQEQDMMGLWELGEKIDSTHNVTKPQDIKDIARNTQGSSNEFCARLLDLRNRPYANSSSLFGICLALIKGLQSTEAISALLKEERDRLALERIVSEQITTISEFIEYQIEQQKDVGWEEEFVRGFLWAKSELSTVLL